jgi:cell wall-associated NlpC family hydrolase
VIDPVLVRGPVRTALLLVLSAALLAGCSSAPRRDVSPAGDEIARSARSLLGTPYRYGGSDPSGFDCSGLVRYVHRAMGIEVPRTALEQHRAARRVSIDDLAEGDLLFFKIDAPRVSHVGIFVGDGRFVHAPRSGRPVELRAFDDAYYRQRLVGAGRLF